MTDPYGIIDLSTLKQSGEGQPGATAGEPSPYEVEVSENTLQQIVQDSTRVPTIMLVTSARAAQLVEYRELLRRGITAQGGAIRLAVVDADAQPGVAGALRVQQIPALFLLLGGQLQPIVEGVAAQSELEQLYVQVLQVAQQQGMDVTGAAGDPTAEPEPEPLPPLLQTAYDAIDAGDLGGAIIAFDEHLSQHPADAQAKAGRATARLLQRTEGADLAASRTAAAEQPQDLAAQLLAADLDMLGGHVDDAFDRLLEQLRGADADTKDTVRERLLELFEVAGPEDPRVGAARKRMANLLF